MNDKSIEKYGEIKVDKPEVEDLFRALDLEYKILLYYLYYACQPVKKIYALQTHRMALEIINLFKHLYEKIDRVHDNALFEEVKKYYAYLLSNHSHYFIRRAWEKTTPESLKFKELTPERLKIVTEVCKYNKSIDHLIPHIFEKNHESPLIVDKSINKSHVGHYHPEFNDNLFEKVKEEEKGVNKYYDLETKLDETKNVRILQYSTMGRCEPEMSEIHEWVTKAIVLAKNSKKIDQSLTKTLVSLGIFIKTGKEADLKQLNEHWAMMENKVDFLIGPYEVYQDPMSIIGSYGAELTIEAHNMKPFQKIWVKLERMLPYPEEYMREKPEPGNISVRTKLFSTGVNGPLRYVAAYCLPNDNELRQKKTKQVIYKHASTQNRKIQEKMRQMIHIEETKDVLKKHDENYQLESDIWTLHVILHETLGHAAGKLHKHPKKGNITDKYLPSLIKGDFDTLEELRADINAAWIAMEGYSDLLGCFDWLKKWDKKMGQQSLKKFIISELMSGGIRRLGSLPKPVKKVEGAHARASLVITNYLLNNGGVELKEEFELMEGKEYLVVGFVVNDLNKVIGSIKELCTKVQKIKSTGDGPANTKLFKWYTDNPIGIEKIRYYSTKLKEKNDYLFNGTSIVVDHYPKLEPQIQNGEIKDVMLKWSSTFLDQ